MRLVLLALALALVPVLAAPAAEASLNVPCVTGGCPVDPICLPGSYCCRYPEPCAPPPS